MFKGYRASVHDGKRLLEMGSSDGCGIIVYLVPPDGRLKNGKNGAFYVM